MNQQDRVLIELEKYRAELQRWVADYQNDHNSRLAMFSSVIEFAKIAIQSAILVNGGACIALLTFLGSAAGNDLEAINRYYILFSTPLLFFSSGLASALMCAFFAYLTQLMYSEHTGTALASWGDAFRGIAIFSGFISVILFVLGCVFAANNFSILSV